MDFYCRVTPQGLTPLDDNDRAAYNRLVLHSDVKVSVRVQRNIGFHRKFFALLRIVSDNLPDDIAQKKGVSGTETLLDALKIDLGYYSTFTVNGRNVIKLSSISFAKMDNADFERFYDMCVTHILTEYLRGTDRNDLLQEVEAFCGVR